MTKFSFNRILIVGSALAMAASLSACATAPGPFNGLGKDPMSMIKIFSSTGKISAEQYLLVQAVASQCKVQIDLQASSPLESIGSSGGAYAAAYAAGGASQSLFYAGVAPGAPAAVGAITGGLGGGVNGALNSSYDRDSSTGDCGEKTLRDWEANVAPDAIKAAYPNMAKTLEGIHASPSYVRSQNGMNAPAKGLVADWKGPVAGSH